MNKLFILVFCLFVFQLSFTQSTLSWVKQMGGTEQDIAQAIAIDNQGNSIVVGTFKGVSSFDNNAGITLTSNGSADAFICKLNASGQVLWAKSFGGINDDVPMSISCDATNNCYITGYFSGTIDIDPGSAVFNVSTPSINTENTYILKLDSNGNFVWGKSIGTDRGFSVKTTNDGILVIGGFWFTEDVDPGPNVFNITSAGLWDVFVLKLNFNGDFLFAKSMGGTGVDLGRSITTDSNNNIIIAGEMSGGGQADYDPGSGTAFLTSTLQSTFVCKLDMTGNFLWAKGIPESGGYANKVVCDNNNNVLIVGLFGNTTDFDPGAGVFNLSTVGFYDAYIWKLDQNGNFIWIKNIGANGADFGHSVTVSSAGNVFISGEFQASFSTDFDPGPGVVNLDEFGGGDVFILQLDANGNYVWGGTMGGSQNYENPYDMAIGPNNSLYTVGRFASQGDMDPGANTLTYTPYGSDDIFIQKLNLTNTNGISELSQSNNPLIFPNPTNGLINIISGYQSFKLYSLEGKLIKEANFNFKQNQIDLSTEVTGTYLLELDGKTAGNIKIIKD